MKIIKVSTYNLEAVAFSDVLICENINEYYGQIIVEVLNDRVSSFFTYFYKLVEDNHKLYVFEP